MKRTKKFLVALLAALSVLSGSLGLAACGENDSASSSNGASVEQSSDSTVVSKGENGSQGLKYTLIDGDAYEVSGIGTCTDTKVVIPSSYNGKAVTSIGDSAFKNCVSLTSVSIPNSVTAIADSAFEDLSNLEYNEKNDLQYLGNEENPYLYLAGVKDNELTSVTIESGCKFIGKSAFSGCRFLTNVTVPDAVTSIGEYAFAGCDGLTSVTIGKGVVSIGNYAFSNCECLESVTLGEKVASIGAKAFYNCDNLTSVEISASVTFIGKEAFYGCNALTVYCAVENQPSEWQTNWNGGDCSIVWDSKNNEIATDGAIYVTSDGLRYALKDGVATLAKQAKNITTATIPSSVSYKGANYVVTSIGDEAFRNCNGLESVTIADSVTTIGNSAFYHCADLTGVTIGKGVTTIGKYAFDACVGLTSVTIPDNVISIDEYAFHNCANLTSLEIGEGVTTIKNYAFCNCSGLTSLEIPDGVTSIGTAAFFGCTGLQEITCSTLAIPSITKNNLQTLVLTSGTAIASKAFYNCGNLKNVTLPASVTSIGKEAFYGCSALTKIAVPEAVTTIGDLAFWGCRSLTEIKVEANNANYKDIDGNLYTKDGTILIQYAIAKKDTSFTVPESVTTINNSAFCNCTVLTNVTIGKAVTSIGNEAFNGCSALASVTMEKSVTSIGTKAFYNCSRLAKITFNGTKTEWNKVTKGENWNYKVPAANVVCTVEEKKEETEK